MRNLARQKKGGRRGNRWVEETADDKKRSGSALRNWIGQSLSSSATGHGNDVVPARKKKRKEEEESLRSRARDISNCETIDSPAVSRLFVSAKRKDGENFRGFPRSAVTEEKFDEDALSESGLHRRRAAERVVTTHGTRDTWYFPGNEMKLGSTCKNARHARLGKVHVVRRNETFEFSSQEFFVFSFFFFFSLGSRSTEMILLVESAARLINFAA